MRLLILIAHPNPDSLSHHIASLVQKNLSGMGHELRIFDLYAMKFDAVAYPNYVRPYRASEMSDETRLHTEAVIWADGLVFIYPIWWWDRPAILKGWFDRIFIWGFAVSLQNHGHVGLLKDKRALVFQTCGESLRSAQASKSEEVVQGNIRDGTLELCGINVDHILTLYQATQLDAIQLQQLEENIKKACNYWCAK